jgi:hypothetical protein
MTQITFSDPKTRCSGSESDLLPSDSVVWNELMIGYSLMQSKRKHSFLTILISNPGHFSESSWSTFGAQENFLNADSAGEGE